MCNFDLNTKIEVSLQDLDGLAKIITEIDSAQAGHYTEPIKELAKQAHQALIRILGKYEIAIYAEADD
jgi:hypothetical protein